MQRGCRGVAEGLQGHLLGEATRHLLGMDEGIRVLRSRAVGLVRAGSSSGPAGRRLRVEGRVRGKG